MADNSCSYSTAACKTMFGLYKEGFMNFLSMDFYRKINCWSALPSVVCIGHAYLHVLKHEEIHAGTCLLFSSNNFPLLLVTALPYFLSSTRRRNFPQQFFKRRMETLDNEIHFGCFVHGQCLQTMQILNIRARSWFRAYKQGLFIYICKQSIEVRIEFSGDLSDETIPYLSSICTEIICSACK